MIKKYSGMLLLIVLLALLPAIAAAELENVYIDNNLPTVGDTNQYSFTWSDTDYLDNGTLTLKNNASIGTLKIGWFDLTIVVPEGVTATIQCIERGTNPQSFAVKGGGTLLVSEGIFTAGLTIEEGTRVEVTNTDGTAIFIDRGYLQVLDGSTLKATGNKTDSSFGGIVMMDGVFINIYDGSTVIAEGYHGVETYNWGTSGNPANIYLDGGSTLQAAGNNGGNAVRLKNGKDDYKGTLKIMDNASVIKLSASNKNNLLNCNTDFTGVYKWRVTRNGDYSWYPYKNYTQESSYTYLEVTRGSVYLPKISPESATMAYDSSQTFTISPTESGMSSAGVTYQWLVDDQIVTNATGSSFTASGLSAGSHTIACQVKYNGDGPMTKTAALQVRQQDISSLAVVDPVILTFGDAFAASIRLNGKTLVHGQDFKIVPYDLTGMRMRNVVSNSPFSVEFMGDYTGSAAGTFTVHPADLKDCDMVFTPDHAVYDGSSHSFSVQMKLGDYLLNQYPEFLSYALKMPSEPMIEPGSYTVSALPETGEHATGYFTGSKMGAFVVDKATPAAADVSMETPVFTFGDSFTAPASFTWTPPTNAGMTMTLNHGVDYTLPSGTVGDVSDAATAELTFTGSRYKGTMSFGYKVSPKAILESDVTLSEDSLTYTGGDVTPTVSVSVKLGDSQSAVTLTEGKDYTVFLAAENSTVASIVDAGTYTMTIKGIGNYTGEVKRTVVVGKANLADYSVTLGGVPFTYDGTPKTPTIDSFTLGGADVPADAYRVSYRRGTQTVTEMTDCGTYTVVIEATGENYSGVKTADFEILPATPAVELEKLAFTYGDRFTQPASFVWKGMTLTAGVDYTLPEGMVGNVTSDATEKICFIGSNYTGEMAFAYSVAPKQIGQEDAQFGALEFVYNGTDNRPEVTISTKLSGNENAVTLVQDTDYTVSILNADRNPVTKAVHAGSYTMQLRGTGNYAGEIEQAYAIVPKDIAADDVVLSAQEFVYNGSDLKPEVTVRSVLGGGVSAVTLEQDTDYTVMILDADGNPAAQTSQAGSYTVQVKGIGNFKGTVEKTYVIMQSSTLLDAALDRESGVYTYGETITVTASVQPGGVASGLRRLLRSAAAPRQMALFAGEIQISDAVDAQGGVYTMTYNTADKDLPVGVSQMMVRYTGDENMDDAAKLLNVTLNKKELTVSGITAESRAYEPGNDRVAVTGATLTGIVNPDDVRVNTDDLTAQIASEHVGTYSEAELEDPVPLTGAAAAYYFAAGASVPVDGGVQITKAAPYVPGMEDEEDGGAASVRPQFEPVYRDGRTLGEVPVSLAENTFNVPGTIAWLDPQDTVVLEGVAYTWVFTPLSSDYETVTGTAIIYPVGDPPVISDPSQDREVITMIYETVTLSVTASDALTYQWYVDDGSGFAAIAGATGPTYTTDRMKLSDDGRVYRCVAGNLYGDTVSPQFTLVVLNLPETGDESRLALWTALLAASMMILSVCRHRKRA